MGLSNDTAIRLDRLKSSVLSGQLLLCIYCASVVMQQHKCINSINQLLIYRKHIYVLFSNENRLMNSYCSQLWIETEWDRDHQTQDKYNTYVTQGSNQESVPLERLSSVKKKCLSPAGLFSHFVGFFCECSLSFKMVDLGSSKAIKL